MSAKHKMNSRQIRNHHEGITARDGHGCHYCKRKTKPGKGGYHADNEATLDHIVPFSLGGSNRRANLVISCFKCNNKFGDDLDKCRCKICKEAKDAFKSFVQNSSWVKAVRLGS